ncbi:DUF368 domain-containing protein [Thaumasiovibrio subtropicus]
MGAADVVPGVSGGTIALITGIYATLLDSIRSFTPQLFGIFKKRGLKGVFNHVNGGFLITLFAGIFTSILTLARLITWMLENHPIPLWSFFFGLILISVVHLAKQMDEWDIGKGLLLVVGVAFAYLITVAHPLQLEPTTFNFFLGGSIAICAMILPGISGSFILLLLGLYAPVIGAVKGLEISTLSVFAAGCIVGLLSFSHLLGWLLRHYKDATMAFLIGLMLGTLNKMWPWKEVLSYRTNSSGEQVPLAEQNLSPFAYEQIVAQPSQLWLALAACIAGICLVLALERISQQTPADS